MLIHSRCCILWFGMVCHLYILIKRAFIHLKIFLMCWIFIDIFLTLHITLFFPFFSRKIRRKTVISITYDVLNVVLYVLSNLLHFRFKRKLSSVAHRSLYVLLFWGQHLCFSFYLLSELSLEKCSSNFKRSYRTYVLIIP